MKKWWMGIVLILALACPAQARAAETVAVTLPDFAVTLNGVMVDNAKRQYPLLVYKGMTYFPLTYDDSRFLGLETSWTEETGLAVERTNVSAVCKEALTASNNHRQQARTVDFPVTVNGEKAQADGTYPFLNFREVTYIPLTWHYCTELFGWEQSFDAKEGLTITADNPQIEQIRLHSDDGTDRFILTEDRLWALDGQEIVNMPLLQPDKRTSVKEIAMETTAWGSSAPKGKFVQVGEAYYFTEDGSNGQRYHLLPNGQWEEIAQGVYIFGDWTVTLAAVDQDTTGNLTIKSLKSGRTAAADTRYHYYTDVSWQGYQQLIQSGDRLYLLANDPHSPRGRMICQVQLDTGDNVHRLWR